MNIDEIPKCSSYVYLQKCPTCLMTCKVLTKRDNDPEYYTQVYVQCHCGEYLEFELPVN